MKQHPMYKEAVTIFKEDSDGDEDSDTSSAESEEVKKTGAVQRQR